jgi:hypothetical protein
MSVPALLNVAAATLEAYNITALSDNPAGATVFSGINVEFASGETKPDVVWRPVADTADGLERVQLIGMARLMLRLPSSTRFFFLVRHIIRLPRSMGLIPLDDLQLFRTTCIICLVLCTPVGR